MQRAQLQATSAAHLEGVSAAFTPEIDRCDTAVFFWKMSPAAATSSAGESTALLAARKFVCYELVEHALGVSGART